MALVWQDIMLHLVGRVDIGQHKSDMYQPPLILIDDGFILMPSNSILARPISWTLLTLNFLNLVLIHINITPDLPSKRLKLCHSGTLFTYP